MLNIQVLGSGLIPRGYGLAPRKEFFKADFTLINTILMTPGLEINAKLPNNKVVPVTRQNVKALWDQYRLDINHTDTMIGNIINENNATIPSENINAESVNVHNPEPPKEVKSEEAKSEEAKSEEAKSEEVKGNDIKVDHKSNAPSTSSDNAAIKPVFNNKKK